MEKGTYISTLLRSKQTVFSTQDIMLIWGETGTNTTRVRIHYYVKKGDVALRAKF